MPNLQVIFFFPYFITFFLLSFLNNVNRKEFKVTKEGIARFPLNLNINNMVAALKEKKAKKSRKNCTKHEKKLKWCCNDCEKIICELCLSLEHKSHRFELISAIVEHKKKEIQEMANELKQPISFLKTQRDKFLYCRKDLLEQKETILELMRTDFATIRYKLDKLESSKMERLETICNAVFEKYDTCLQIIQVSLAHAEEKHNAMMELLNNGSDLEICQKKLSKDLLSSELLHSLNSWSKFVVGSKLRYHFDMKEINQFLDEKLILENDVEYRCSIEGPVLAISEEETLVELIVKNERNERVPGLNVLDDVIRISFIDTRTPSPLSNPEILISNGVIRFKTKELGQITLNIYLDPLSLSFSLPILVSPPPYVPIESFGRIGKKADFAKPISICLDYRKRVIVLDKSCTVSVFSFDGKCECKFGKYGRDAGEFIEPNFIAVDSQNRILVSDCALSRIQIFSPEGKFILQFSIPTKKHQKRYLQSFCVDSNDCIFVVGESLIQKFDRNGLLITTLMVGKEIRAVAFRAKDETFLVKDDKDCFSFLKSDGSKKSELPFQNLGAVWKMEAFAFNDEGSILMLEPTCKQMFIFSAEGDKMLLRMNLHGLHPTSLACREDQLGVSSTQGKAIHLFGSHLPFILHKHSYFH
jgi:hypothetical protein